MSAEHYEVVRKWSNYALPDIGHKFMYKGAEYEVLGAVLAGNKLRAQSSTDGKVYLFPVKDLAKKYGIRN